MASSRAIELLNSAFPAVRLAIPNTHVYNARITSYASQLESDLSPKIIFLPETTEEVSTFVKLITPLVHDGEAKFAIRGAGCQPLPGCANIDGGITVDLSRLVGTKLDKSNGTVCVAAGEHWDAVYTALHDDGLGVTGARSALNGIGGLALSGTNLDFTSLTIRNY
jgi:FAD/FMN-containing dehydrogenase